MAAPPHPMAVRLIYLSAVLSKLVFGSLEWLNGYTLQYFLIQDPLRKGTLLGGWFSQYRYLVMLFAVCCGAVLDNVRSRGYIPASKVDLCAARSRVPCR